MIETTDTPEGGLKQRSSSRELTLMKSTMALITSFVTDGDTLDEAK